MVSTNSHAVDCSTRRVFVLLQSMFNMVNSSCASDTTTTLLNQATANLGESFFRSSFSCTQEQPVWSTSTDALDRTIFCGYKEVGPAIVSPLTYVCVLQERCL